MADLPHGLVRISGRYRLKKRIGFGSFGEVFQATDIMSETEVAVKLESTDVTNPKLHKEWKVYQALAKRPHSVGFPQVHFFGLDRGYRALVLSLQGPSLGELLAFCGSQFSVKTVCMLAIRI
ncbi:hypothetical protein H0H92_000508, partial [Tricholoma furcatifolium]